MLALQKAGLEVGYNPVGQNGGSYFCIPTGAPHAAEAMKFLAFMASDEGQQIIADNGIIPTKEGFTSDQRMANRTSATSRSKASLLI